MKILENGTVEKTKFDEAVENLIATCGFDKSESGSMWFIELLEDCLAGVSERIQKSMDEEGLCWDACHDLASELEKYGPARAEEHRRVNMRVVQ